MRTFARFTLAALLVAFADGRARAADDACQPDVERLCAGITKGGGRIAACLKANEAQVSPACKAELASVRRVVKEVGEVCADDIQSLCADVKPGGGEVLRCLNASYFSLTPGCQEVVRGAREKAAEFQKACGKDAKKLCKGIRPGQGRVLACLESRKAELSPACQGMMAK
jgi:cysteine rich repeat protein